ncbi:MAG: quinone-dependent dihydroorotate dehydrogenase [Gammaproteobacteria bacterium]|nr:quinone-dependent dihydroorotate dehydrogenase [Gammaproteobacteria bacterium]
MMYKLLRPLLFRLDAETSHDLVLNALAKASNSQAICYLISLIYGTKGISKPKNLMGLTFPNPVGLAAGLDKQANASNALHAFGFGWVELGTVTPQPQPGNQRPRMFRLSAHDAIINRMGFNSIGLDEFVKNLATINPNIIKGINIGKNAATPMEHANEDYLIGLRRVAELADYVTINISSPNTRNLRDLQQDDQLDALLGALNNERKKLSDKFGKPIPLVLKIAPDVDQVQIHSITRLLLAHEIDGVAATNTTLSRQSVQNSALSRETGGLSGSPMHNQSVEVIAALRSHLQGAIPIIGIGGIDSPQAAITTLQAGADMIQLYTGLIYQGPTLVSRILKEIKKTKKYGV